MADKANGVAPGSVLADLRKMRAAHQEERHTDIEIPGYSGKLYMRATPVPWETLRGIAQRADKAYKNSPRRDLMVAADTLLHACQMILAPDAKGELTPLHELAEVGGEPVRFDSRLAELLGIEEAKSARDVLFGVFPDELAVTSTYVEVVEAQANANVEIDEAVFQGS